MPLALDIERWTRRGTREIDFRSVLPFQQSKLIPANLLESWSPNISSSEHRPGIDPPLRQRDIEHGLVQVIFSVWADTLLARISIWGGDDTTMERTFGSLEAALEVYEALDRCPSMASLKDFWGFT